MGKRGYWIYEGESLTVNLNNAKEQLEAPGQVRRTELHLIHRTELHLKCSACGKITTVDSSIKYEYCPHCSAEMFDPTGDNEFEEFCKFTKQDDPQWCRFITCEGCYKGWHENRRNKDENA